MMWGWVFVFGAGAFVVALVAALVLSAPRPDVVA